MHQTSALSLPEVATAEPSGAMDRALVTFEDVAVYFTRKEWEMLTEEQKTLYKEVMNNNYQLILSLNCPDIIQNIELGCDPYIRSQSDSEHTGSWQEKISEEGSSFLQGCSDTPSSRCEAQVKRTRRYPRVNPFRWVKKDKKKKSRSSRSSHRTSRRSEDKKTPTGDEVNTSKERSSGDPSTLPDCASNLQDEPLLTQGCEAPRAEEGSEHETAVESSLPPEEAMGSCERREEVSQDMKNCEEPTDTSQKENGVNSGLLEAESPDKVGTRETETGEERRSPTTRRASPRKKDRHVKFSEVVTMILIEQHGEERSQGRRLSNINEKTEMEACGTGQEVAEDGGTSQDQGALPCNVEGTPRKRMIVPGCKAEEGEGSLPDTAKKRIVGGMGTSQCTPELQSKSVANEGHELYRAPMNDTCHANMKREDTHSGPPPPDTPLNSQEQRLTKSYSCTSCRKVTHWSKLSVQQKENIERSIAHVCRRCHQMVRPPSLTTAPRAGETSQPVSTETPAASPAQPNTQRILSDEKKQRIHKGGRNEKTAVKPRSLASDQRAGGDPMRPQDGCKSSVCRRCRDSGATVDPLLQTFTGSSSTEETSAPGQDSRKSRSNTKDKKETTRSSEANKEHAVCTKCGKRFVSRQRSDPSSSGQQKKPTKSPSVLQKMQDHPLKTHSTYANSMGNSSRIVDPEKTEPDQDGTKCGTSLAEHVNPKNPGEGGEKCVLRPKKKRKRLLEEMEPFQCNQCGKVFTRHFTLLQHRMIHTGERPYACKECGKTFRDGGYLKVHMRLHTKEKPYTCSECGKCFGMNSALVVHLRTHTDERPFECSVCGKRFSDRSTYRHHQMIHTGEKPFTCSFCGKKFTQQAHVKRHEKMHTGERPFGCTVCEKRFIDRTKLRKHELIHTRKKV